MDEIDKLIDKTGPTYIFADESGKLSDPNQNIVILSAVIIYGARITRVNNYFKSLKEKVSKWGIDISSPDFEFHAKEIFQREKCWRKLTNAQIDNVAKSLRNSIKESGLSFVIIKIDKREKGFNKFLDDFSNIKKQGISGLSMEQQNYVNKLLAKLGIRTGIGKLGNVISLFFGLITGQISWENFHGEATVIVDDQFLNGVEMWQLIYRLNSFCFSLMWDLIQPELDKHSKLPKWPKNNPPKWHLGNKVDIKNSRDYFGLQLADFLAYTTAHIDNTGDTSVNRWALVGKTDLVSLEFGNSIGVWATTSSKLRMRLFLKSFAALPRWLKLIYRKVYSRF